MMYGSLSYRHIMLLTASQDILYAPHHQWNLLDPVDFMTCYSFLCTLAGTTVTLRQELEPAKSRSICCLLPLARGYSAYYRWTEKT